MAKSEVQLRSFRPRVRRRVQFKPQGLSMTKQSFKEECDIDRILKKYRATGVIDHVKRGVPQYGDFSNIPDYQNAIHAVRLADEKFMDLPADIRKRFDNDPGKFLMFVQDPKNLDELRDMGLANKKEPVEAPVAGKAADDSKKKPQE